ncbi:MAG: hypothetical protein M3134_08985 [Actinomycetota bacterium]|nr:hypothetical protein [Actinomycetota bacterium]
MPDDGPDLWHPTDDDTVETAEAAYNDYTLLKSELMSLYDEFDKLTKKAPNNRLSPLALETVNALIGDAKALLGGDRYVDRVSQFVAAGETPQNSDVLLVLATLVKALARFREVWWHIWDDLEIT